MFDVYDGYISDVETVGRSGILDTHDEDDMILADRGFNIRYLLYANKVDLEIPPFLVHVTSSHLRNKWTQKSFRNFVYMLSKPRKDGNI